MQKIVLFLLVVCMTFLNAQDFKPWKSKIDKLSAFEKHIIDRQGYRKGFFW